VSRCSLSEQSAASHLLTHFPHHHKRANKGDASAPADRNHHDEALLPEEGLEARSGGGKGSAGTVIHWLPVTGYRVLVLM